MKRTLTRLRRAFSRKSSSIASGQIVSREIQVSNMATSATSYTIKSGDTFVAIATSLGITLSALQGANPGVNPNNLQVGQVIQLPKSGSLYTIQPGDTFTSIASKFGTTVSALETANPSVNENNLQVGAIISIPSAVQPTPVQPTPPAPQPLPQPPATANGKYTVQSGDTYELIAKKLGTTVAALQAANVGVNERNLQVGQQITIPTTTPPTTIPAPTQPTPPTQPPATSNKYSIQAGDTFTSIAAKLGVTLAALEAVNQGVNANNLQVGQQINVPATPVTQPQPQPQPPVVPPVQPQPTPPTEGKYTIQAGDTFSSIAAKLGVTVEGIQVANPGVDPRKLQVGQQIAIPSKTSQPPVPVQPTPTPPVQPAPPTGNTYTIQAGDTLSAVATRFSTTLAAILAANPGINPGVLQIGQNINLPTGATPAPGISPAPETGGYVSYSGPAANYPDPSKWAPYESLWAKNASLMSYNDSASEIALIGTSITLVSAESGIDPRVILCIIMQESGGNVRVGNTFNGVNNTGIMQAFDGVQFNPADPAGSILQMIRDGSEGSARGPGLKQAYAEFGNWYEAARKYNSGSVDRNQLNNALGATGKYVVDFANRLMGHTWPGM